MKDITIVATTWLPPGKEDRRLEDFLKALWTWREFLKYDGHINLHISDDGTTEEWFIKLQKAVQIIWKDELITFSQQQRHGVGASLNTGLNKAFETSPLALHMVDDWELLDSYDLNNWVKFMEDPNYDVGMIRFFPHPDLTGTFRHIPPYGWAVILDPHHYVFATRPCLWHKRFFDCWGSFKENVSAIETEADFNNRVVNRQQPIEGGKIWLALPEMWRHMDAFSLSELVPA